MVTDVACWVGEFAYRHLGELATVDWVLHQMDRLHIDEAWVGSLPAVVVRDPRPCDEALKHALAGHADRLRFVPTVQPCQARWEEDVRHAAERGAPAIRVYPHFHGLDPGGSQVRDVVTLAAEAGLPVQLTVRLEDMRQRSAPDPGIEVAAAAVRRLVRSVPHGRVLVTHAGREFIEEVHFGLTRDEARRVLWEVSWIWGPPEDHLALLMETIGVERFTFGTGMPLRIPDAAMAKVDLLEIDEGGRERLLGKNLAEWARS